MELPDIPPDEPPPLAPMDPLVPPVLEPAAPELPDLEPCELCDDEPAEPLPRRLFFAALAFFDDEPRVLVRWPADCEVDAEDDPEAPMLPDPDVPDPPDDVPVCAIAAVGIRAATAAARIRLRMTFPSWEYYAKKPVSVFDCSRFSSYHTLQPLVLCDAAVLVGTGNLPSGMQMTLMNRVTAKA